MKDRAFIDTNIIIYLYSEDEPEKRTRSESILEKYYCIISTQVLNEISNVMIKKFKLHPFDVLKVLEEIENNFEIYNINFDSIKLALNILDRYKYSYYDSLIISSAIESGCKYLLSEDMNNSQDINGLLQIKNIYRE